MYHFLAQASDDTNTLGLITAAGVLFSILLAIVALIKKPTEKLEKHNAKQDEKISQLEKDLAALQQSHEYNHKWLERVDREGKKTKKIMHRINIALVLIMQKLEIKIPNADASGITDITEDEDS